MSQTKTARGWRLSLLFLIILAMVPAALAEESAGLYHLGVFFVFVIIYLILVAIQHMIKESSGAQLAIGSLAAGLMAVLFLLIASGFYVVENTASFIANPNSYLMLLIIGMAAYAMLYGLNIHMSSRKTRSEYDPY